MHQGGLQGKEDSYSKESEYRMKETLWEKKGKQKLKTTKNAKNCQNYKSFAAEERHSKKDLKF